MASVLQATDLHYVYVVKKTKQSPAMRDDPRFVPYVEYKVGHSCSPEKRVNSSSAGDKYVGDVQYLAFCVSSSERERKRLATSLEANIIRQLHICNYQVEDGEPDTKVEVFTCGAREPNEITRTINRLIGDDPDFKLATITNAPVRQLEWTCEPIPGYRLTRANGELFVRTVATSGGVETTAQPPPPRDEKVPLDISSIPLDDDLFWDKYLATAPTETQRAEMKRVLDEGGNALRQRYRKAVEYAILKGELLMEKDKHHHKSVYFEDHLDLWSHESVLIWIDRADQYGRETFGQGQLAAALRTHFMKMYGGPSRKRKRNRSLKR